MLILKIRIATFSDNCTIVHENDHDYYDDPDDDDPDDADLDKNDDLDYTNDAV